MTIAQANWKIEVPHRDNAMFSHVLSHQVALVEQYVVEWVK